MKIYFETDCTFTSDNHHIQAQKHIKMKEGSQEVGTSAPAVDSSAPETTSRAVSPPQDDTNEDAPAADGSEAPMSKNALKKKLKREAWEAGKADRRILSKERRKRQRANQQAKKRELAESGEAPLPSAKRIKKCVFNAHVVIDCAFDEGMSEKETHSMAQQLSFCYASNKRASNPFRSLIFSGPSATSELLSASEDDSEVKKEVNPSSVQEGYTKLLEESSRTGVAIPFASSRTGKQLSKMGDSQYLRWKNVEVVEQGGLESLLSAESSRTPSTDLSSCIYLTADTDETIETLEEGKTYIIGGIVDRNRYKNLCLERAQKLGMKVAKLPISAENLGGKVMNSRKVLTVNQVFDILLGWTNQLHPQNQGGKEGAKPNWREALVKGLPGRKFLENQPESAGAVESGETEAKVEEEVGDTPDPEDVADDGEPNAEADVKPGTVKRSLSVGSNNEKHTSKEARTE